MLQALVRASGLAAQPLGRRRLPSSHSIARKSSPSRRFTVGHVAHDARVRSSASSWASRMKRSAIRLRVGVQELERDRLAGGPIERAVHRAHSAAAGEPLKRETFGEELARLPRPHARRIIAKPSARPRNRLLPLERDVPPLCAPRRRPSLRLPPALVGAPALARQSTDHPDGWGIAHLERGPAPSLREAAPAHDSRRLPRAARSPALGAGGRAHSQGERRSEQDR